ncbi:MAG TPA: diacylglycerol kinase family protein [Candidatus Saccharimonadales bacterium]|nr:diacylglycerol kinase family protein [Candidatus Saccharimonadales bacterium]
MPVQQTVTIPTYCIIWRNPGSTNDAKVQTFIEALERAKLTNVYCITVDTSKLAASKQRLIRLLNKHANDCWLLVSGGDGTVGSVINILKKSSLTKTPPILPLPAGNSNDIATMLHGKRMLTVKRLANARKQPVHIMECNLQAPGHKAHVQYAAAYISFGITAQTAKSINLPAHRNSQTDQQGEASRRIKEVRRFSNVLSQAKPFHITEDNQERILYERILVNGRRMAKYFRLPAELSEAAFRDIAISDYSPLSNLKHLSMLATKQLHGIVRQRGETVQFTCNEPIMSQFDGETLAIQKETTLTIRVDESPLTFISLVTHSRS